jgi:hypothetical protein
VVFCQRAQEQPLNRRFAGMDLPPPVQILALAIRNAIACPLEHIVVTHLHRGRIFGVYSHSPLTLHVSVA